MMQNLKDKHLKMQQSIVSMPVNDAQTNQESTIKRDLPKLQTLQGDINFYNTETGNTPNIRVSRLQSREFPNGIDTMLALKENVTGPMSTL